MMEQNTRECFLLFLTHGWLYRTVSS